MKTFLTSIFALSLYVSMSAQVGVNNSSPEQALDVNGKIKITDDSTDPSAGTMRYNNTESAFEGYDGIQWNSFTTQQTSALPSNPVPMRGYSETISPGESKSLTFKDWMSNDSFQTPPSGKLLIITGIYPSSFNFNDNDSSFRFLLGVTETLGGRLHDIGEDGLGIFAETNVTTSITGDGAPLFVVRPGQYLTAYCSSSTEVNRIIVSVRGFLVDDLNY